MRVLRIEYLRTARRGFVPIGLENSPTPFEGATFSGGLGLLSVERCQGSVCGEKIDEIRKFTLP